MDEIRPIKPPRSPSERAEAVKPAGDRKRRERQKQKHRRGRRPPKDPERDPTASPDRRNDEEEPGQIIDLEA
jgi:hypothetical protein